MPQPDQSNRKGAGHKSAKTLGPAGLTDRARKAVSTREKNKRRKLLLNRLLRLRAERNKD